MIPSTVGADNLFYVARPGDYVGLSAVYQPDYVLGVKPIAYTKAEIMLLNAEKIRSWRPDPRSIPLFDFFGRHICGAMREAKLKTMILAGNTITERFRRYLNVRMAHDNSRTITIPGSESDLANYLCVNKCALCRVLTKLRQEGRITYRGNVVTVSPDFDA